MFVQQPAKAEQRPRGWMLKTLCTRRIVCTKKEKREEELWRGFDHTTLSSMAENWEMFCLVLSDSQGSEVRMPVLSEYNTSAADIGLFPFDRNDNGRICRFMQLPARLLKGFSRLVGPASHRCGFSTSAITVSVQGFRPG